MCKRCLYCYEPLLIEGENDFHKRCCRKFFGTDTPPLLPFEKAHLGSLARRVLASHTTIPGVQEKLSVDYETVTTSTRLTIVGLWGRFILKPPSERYPFLPEVEDLTMHLAQQVGIITVPHTLIRLQDGSLCYLTRRIDRRDDGTKIAMEDMCQLSGRLTEDKYRSSYEQIVKTIQRYSSIPQLDVVNFWEQVLFAWLTGNADMHLKNYSLYAPNKDQYILTPAYDLVATKLLLPSDTEELALTLKGKKRKLYGTQFQEVMIASGLLPKVVEKMFTKYRTIVSSWENMIKRSFIPLSVQQQFIELIHERIGRL